MRLTTRQTGVISYAGFESAALLDAAARAFAHAEEEVPARFAAFLPLFPTELVVNMSYLGKGPKASPEGFSLSPDEYHQKLSQEKPGLYISHNRDRCFKADGTFRGGVVTVDTAWARAFPQYEPFMGERLMIHMIGGGHQAVAVPESVFPKSGGVLASAERDLGITARCSHYCAWMRERLRLGDKYDPVRFEEEYLSQTQLSVPLLRQQELARAMQDRSIARTLQASQPAPAALYTETARPVKDIPQYVPYRCACDVFEESPVTRQTGKLAQLYYEGDDFLSDLWMPWEDVKPYLDRKKMRLNAQAVCDGFQIAPATDADTRGGVYPGKLRIVSVIDRSLLFMVADTLNNPAYGTGLNPMGKLNRRIYLKNSAGMIKQGQLLQETHSIICENLRIPEEDLLRMRAMAEWQEHKGRLIDAMYRREVALAQMQPGTPVYERTRDVLDARVQRLSLLIKDSPTAYSQRSGYDADIEYLCRKAEDRIGLVAAFTPDPQRERSIESGFAMREKVQKYALADLHEKPAKEPRGKEMPKRQRAANGQWFEQMDFFSSLEK